MSKEYLKQPLIPNFVFDITDDHIEIYNENTVLISVRRAPRLCQKELLDLYSKILHYAKQHNVKVKYRHHHKQYIQDNWAKYTQEYKNYDYWYKSLLGNVNELKKRGIHRGFVDDSYYNQCKKLAYELEYGSLYTPTMYTMMTKQYWLRNLSGALAKATVKPNEIHL